MAAPMKMFDVSKVLLYFIVFNISVMLFDEKIVSGHTADIGDDPSKPDIDPTSSRADFYSFEVDDIGGNRIKMDRFKRKVLLIVNVASECGFTDDHYKMLVELQRSFGKTGAFSVLGFPCNQFGAQEPNTNDEIKRFVHNTYQVNFPMFAKINVIEENVPPLWKYLVEKSGAIPNWNFWKYLVSSDGKVLQAWGPWNDWNDEIIPVIKAEVEKDRMRHHPDEL